MTNNQNFFQSGKWYKFMFSLPMHFKQSISENDIENRIYAKENSCFLLFEFKKSEPPLECFSDFNIKILYEGKIYYLHYCAESSFGENPEDYIVCLK